MLGGGVAVCLLLLAHRAVIFAIAQHSCYLPALPPSERRRNKRLAAGVLCIQAVIWRRRLRGFSGCTTTTLMLGRRHQSTPGNIPSFVACVAAARRHCPGQQVTSSTVAICPSHIQ